MKTAPLATRLDRLPAHHSTWMKGCREGCAPSESLPLEPSVAIEGSRYLVIFNGESPLPRHLVNKNKECSCGKQDCPAIEAVKRYLQAGGQRAPDLEAPACCPICGSPVQLDRHWNGKYSREAGWRCTSGGLAHFLEAKAKRIQEQLSRNPWLIPPARGYPGLRRDDLLTWQECQAANRKVFLETGYDPTA